MNNQEKDIVALMTTRNILVNKAISLRLSRIHAAGRNLSTEAIIAMTHNEQNNLVAIAAIDQQLAEIKQAVQTG